VPSSRERFHSSASSTRKKPAFGGLRLVLVVGTVLALSYFAPQLDMRKLMSGAISKQNRGIVLNYFDLSPKRTVEILGKPDTKQPYRENEELLYWKFDPVTLEIHFHEDQVSRIAYATSLTTIRDHIEGRVLKVYGNKQGWKQRRRNIDGEVKVVYENEASQMTVVTYEESVMVYHYLFPESHAITSE
jgi:hypothetical protein